MNYITIPNMLAFAVLYPLLFPIHIVLTGFVAWVYKDRSQLGGPWAHNPKEKALRLWLIIELIGFILCFASALIIKIYDLAPFHFY